jgi:hypothetical protein
MQLYLFNDKNIIFNLVQNFLSCSVWDTLADDEVGTA